MSAGERRPTRLDHVHRHYLRVRFAETDQMGVAHHGSYVPWIEEARTEWMRATGRTYRAMEEAGLSLAVTRLAVRYLSSALYDDRLRIDTRLESVRMASLDFAYRIIREEEDEDRGGAGDEEGGGGKETVIAEAETRLALLGDNGRPRRLPADLFAGH